MSGAVPPMRSIQTGPEAPPENPLTRQHVRDELLSLESSVLFLLLLGHPVDWGLAAFAGAVVLGQLFRGWRAYRKWEAYWHPIASPWRRT